MSSLTENWIHVTVSIQEWFYKINVLKIKYLSSQQKYYQKRRIFWLDLSVTERMLCRRINPSLAFFTIFHWFSVILPCASSILTCRWITWESRWNANSDSVTLGQSLRFCISNNLLGDANAPVLWTEASNSFWKEPTVNIWSC